jgi:hypothetical protein
MSEPNIEEGATQAQHPPESKSDAEIDTKFIKQDYYEARDPIQQIIAVAPKERPGREAMGGKQGRGET